MRFSVGMGLLALGVAGLGYWAFHRDAHRIQDKVTAAAAQVVAGSVHGAGVAVSGRDITLTGTIDGPAELDVLVAGLEAVAGRRVVHHDAAQVLTVVAPYDLTVTKSDGGVLSAKGHVPTEVLRKEISADLGGAADSLVLAAGAPKDWAVLSKAGLSALEPMTSGKMSLVDTALVVEGTVLGPAEEEAVLTALSAFGGQDVQTKITLLDDGKPADYDLAYDAGQGAVLTGKLPKGMGPSDMMAAMGIKDFTAKTIPAYLGDRVDAANLSGLASVMPMVETLTMTVRDKARRIDIGVQGDVDPQAVAAAVQAALPGDQVNVTVIAPQGQNGAQRDNAATGQAQRYMGGFWVTLPKLDPTLAGCQTAADAVLANKTITFVSGKDELDQSATGVINELAGVFATCADEVGLAAEIGGHTDNVGDPIANLGLSQRRAIAVRLALIARGVAGSALISIGYGDSLPVADNATDEGRAKNRRTTIKWSE